MANATTTLTIDCGPAMEKLQEAIDSLKREARQGWVCPVCGSCWSPAVAQCTSTECRSVSKPRMTHGSRS